MKLVVKNIFNCDGEHISQFYINGKEVTFNEYNEALDYTGEFNNDCDEDCDTCSYCKYADNEPETIQDLIEKYRDRIKDNGCLCNSCLDAILEDMYEELADKIIEAIDED